MIACTVLGYEYSSPSPDDIWVGRPLAGSQDPAGRPAGAGKGEVGHWYIFPGNARLSLSLSLSLSLCVFPGNASEHITGTANRNRNRNRNGKAATVTVTAGLDD